MIMTHDMTIAKERGFQLNSLKAHLATLSPTKNLAMSWSLACHGSPLARTQQSPSTASSRDRMPCSSRVSITSASCSRTSSQISFCRIAAMLMHSATACSQSLEDVVDAGEIPRSAKAKGGLHFCHFTNPSSEKLREYCSVLPR